MASELAASPVPLHALQHVRGVAAFERFDDPVVHLPGGVGDFVEKPAVVRHHQQPTGITWPALLQMAGQPGDALDVEVVGGLVQSDHVPLADQQLGQLHPSPLAAAEGADRGIPADVGHQSANHVAHPRVTRPLVFGLVADECPADGVARVEGVCLAQRADPQSATPGDPAGVWPELAGQQPEQAGLAVSVASDDADARPVVDAERDRVEHQLIRVFEVYRLGSKQMRHRADASPTAVPTA